MKYYLGALCRSGNLVTYNEAFGIIPSVRYAMINIPDISANIIAAVFKLWYTCH